MVLECFSCRVFCESLSLTNSCFLISTFFLSCSVVSLFYEQEAVLLANLALRVPTLVASLVERADTEVLSC